MNRKYSLSALVLSLSALSSSGQLVISQYYEGSSSNKYIELTNAGSESIDLSTYTLTLWSNAGSEDWKSGVGTPTSSEPLLGNLASGGSLLIANGNAASPVASDDADLTSGAINFNGNDSVVLYNGVVGEVASIADAFSATGANEGANTSVVRKNTDVGFDTVLSSSFFNFPDVWEVVATDTVDQAVSGADEFLGSSALGMSLPGLALSLDPANFSEGAGAGASTGTVTRSGDLSLPLVVNLASADETELTVPASITIAADSATGTFSIAAIDDEEQDFEQTARIVASADGFLSASADAVVEDDEPSVEITIDVAMISEMGGTATGTLTVSEASASGYTFSLASSDTSEATVPTSVSIPANQTSVTFSITAVDDADTDGTQVVTLTATDQEALLLDVNTTIAITDDEDFVAPSIVINEIRIDDVGADDDEYIELYSETPDLSLNLLTVIVIGDGSTGSGTIEDVYSLSGFTMNGNYFVASSDTFSLSTPDLTLGGSGIFENSDNLTVLLVSEFTGAIGDDIDDDDDGTPNTTLPWGEIIDGVSLLESADVPPIDTEFAYATAFSLPSVGPDGFFVPGHVFRSPNGSGEWQIGPFQSVEGDPNAEPPIEAMPTLDSPGAENSGAVPPGGDNLEIVSFSIDQDSGSGVLTVTGLGIKVWLLQVSDDLGATDTWETLPGGFSESDNPDGSTNLTFFDTFSTTSKRFYRLIEQ